MDSYLEIAEIVLRAAKRPLSPKAIVEIAYRAGIVPSHLFGKAQHKTLQARLSEDILKQKLESKFFRTNPGVFFLSEFRSDPQIPSEFKDPFHARRRTRDLVKSSTLAVTRKFVESNIPNNLNWSDFLASARSSDAIRYVEARTDFDDLYIVWAFSVVRRDKDILSYRIGKYRDDRDSFSNRRSIGFSESVSFDNASLFSHDFGIAECGLDAVLTDLDLSRSVFVGGERPEAPEVLFYMAVVGSQPVLIFVMEWLCPDWFEPTTRRLSLNELRWIDSTHIPNDISDFEPWSAEALIAIIKDSRRNSYDEKNKRTAGRAIRIRANAR
ncbi:HB1, ASXL, restriction endonuclease HTH domain [Bosea sp. CRIB-10]|uniref:winged helix-turn-helix domain-containing protein n=1 Tax=Bosea sp. CRIB-10 TaxID=378404 RepID=UPI0008E1E0BA|nr:winged helix-turn-helix domain-containing protein [Bosea sp. CRIB-10]SFC59151.1 HB1, ASXL, restriction endonuclease HTH domain [Bosea sp. CRIB-10]